MPTEDEVRRLTAHWGAVGNSASRRWPCRTSPSRPESPRRSSSPRRLLQQADLVDAARVAAALERRGHERLDARQRHLAADDPRAHRQHVGVVVLAAEPCGDRIGRLHAADAADLVGNDLLAGAAAAQDDAELALAGCHGARGWRDDVGIVDRLGRIDAEVDHLVAGQGQPVGDRLLQREAGVVGRQGNAHGSP